MDYTVTKLAIRFGLSRSTLLYYDRIGLFSPSIRTEAKYRIYNEHDFKKLEQLCILREAGLSLFEIKMILERQSGSGQILYQRLQSIQHEIGRLRQQQRHVVKLLGQPDLLHRLPYLTKESWISILRASGLDEEGMDQWHREFEKSAPEAHQDFLESLGLTRNESVEIRKRYAVS